MWDLVDSPETPVKINMKSGALEETELSAVNRAFGRKFNIVLPLAVSRGGVIKREREFFFFLPAPLPIHGERLFYAPGRGKAR